MPNTSVNANLQVKVTANTSAAKEAISSLEEKLSSLTGKEQKIRVGIDGTAAKEIEKLSASLQNLNVAKGAVGKKPLDTKVDTKKSTNDLKNFSKMVKSQNRELKQTFKGFEIPYTSGSFDGIKKEWSAIEKDATALGKNVSVTYKQMGKDMVVSFKEGTQAAQDFQYSLTQKNGKDIAFLSKNKTNALFNKNSILKDYEDQYAKMQTILQKKKLAGNEDATLKKQFDDQYARFNSLRNSSYLTENALSEFNTKHNSLKQSFSNQGLLVDSSAVKNAKEVEAAYNRIINLQNKMANFFNSNKKAKDFGNASALRQQVEGLVSAYKTTGTFTDEQINEINKLNGEFTQFKTQALEAGVASNSVFGKLTSKFKTLGTYMMTSMSFQYMLQGVKSIVSNVVDLDSALTELKKVSSGSADDYKKVITDAGSIAQQTGNTVSDVIRSASDWARQGYGLEDSTKLAKVAALYQNVGDNIDIDTATSSLTSTLQGFGLQADQAESVVDKFNAVSNNFAISSDDIGEALRRSSASFKTANTDLSQAIALTTGTNSVVQDAARTGNMWKTVSARIRGASTELETMGEDTDNVVTSSSKLQNIVQSMTGFDIMESDGKTFKNMYDIIVGIGEVWDSLSDIDQAALLETLAGKNQANALAAALNNVDMIKEAYQTAEYESEGSAEQENARYMESIQGRLGQLKATFQETSSNLADSDFLKGAVSGANEFLQVINQITSAMGSLGTIAVGGGIAAFIKNFD